MKAITKKFSATATFFQMTGEIFHVKSTAIILLRLRTIKLELTKKIMTWKEPKYGTFNHATDFKNLLEKMTNANRSFICYE